jgi:hypothetical protein
MDQFPVAFWSLSTTDMLRQLQTTQEGLTSAEAGQRLARYGANLLKPQKRSDVLTLLLSHPAVTLQESDYPHPCLRNGIVIFLT